MTPDERQALREKHYNMGNVIGRNGHNDSCAGCGDISPCDVIKVLDAWERQEHNTLIQGLIHFADDE